MVNFWFLRRSLRKKSEKAVSPFTMNFFLKKDTPWHVDCHGGLG